MSLSLPVGLGAYLAHDQWSPSPRGGGIHRVCCRREGQELPGPRYVPILSSFLYRWRSENPGRWDLPYPFIRVWDHAEVQVEFAGNTQKFRNIFWREGAAEWIDLTMTRKIALLLLRKDSLKQSPKKNLLNLMCHQTRHCYCIAIISIPLSAVVQYEMVFQR